MSLHWQLKSKWHITCLRNSIQSVIHLTPPLCFMDWLSSNYKGESEHLAHM